MNKKSVENKLILPNGQIAPFSKAYKKGGLLFVSRQLGFNTDGSLNTADVATQTTMCLQ